jgi:hypothetical protein
MGYIAGQNSGFEDMQSPWIHYDAYDIKFRNNIITATQSAGMAISAGYNVLLANNTLYNVGQTRAPIAVQLGVRFCVDDLLTCGAYLAQRGWVPPNKMEVVKQFPTAMFLFTIILFSTLLMLLASNIY